MKFLKLNDEQKNQLDILNAKSPHVKASPVQAEDGKWYLCADLLADCSAGQTYEFCGEFLKALPKVDEPEWEVEAE